MRSVPASLAILALAAGPAAAGPSVPVIAIIASAPVTVVGTHYRPGRTARVTLSGTVRASRAVVVNRNGRFRMIFSNVRLGRCSAALVVVRSDGVATRTLKRLPAPDCPPPA